MYPYREGGRVHQRPRDVVCSEVQIAWREFLVHRDIAGPASGRRAAMGRDVLIRGVPAGVRPELADHHRPDVDRAGSADRPPRPAGRVSCTDGDLPSRAAGPPSRHFAFPGRGNRASAANASCREARASRRVLAEGSLSPARATRTHALSRRADGEGPSCCQEGDRESREPLDQRKEASVLLLLRREMLL